MSELPDMDKLLRDANRREGKSMIVVGALVLAAGVGAFLGSRSLFGGHVWWVAPSTIALGAVLLGRGLLQRAS